MSASERPRFGVGLAPYARWTHPSEMVAVARAADEAGFDFLFMPDHVAIPVESDQPRSGSVFYDVFVLASHLAAVTKQIRFVFCALVVPLRHPLLVARMFSTLDQLSEGRVGMVAGSGWMAAEFAALHLPYDERGAMTDEYLRALKVLWTSDRPQFQGRYVSFPAVTLEPKCVQRPHPPIWIGGNGPRPFQRVIDLGDGWWPLSGTFEEHSTAIAHLRTKAEAVGRDPDSLAFVGSVGLGAPGPWLDRLSRGHHASDRDRTEARARRARLAGEVQSRVDEATRAGFTHLVAGVDGSSTQQLIDHLWSFADQIIAAR